MSDTYYPAKELRLQSVTLVIDDGPTQVTSTLIDALEASGHRAVLFVLGCNISGNEAVLVDAIRRGFALGNHSFMHPHFSEISVEVARDEIVRTDTLIDALYATAGVTRHGRWFRFPYLDTGGVNYEEFQSLLAELQFTVPDTVRSRLSPVDRVRFDWPTTVSTRDWALPSQPDFRASVMTAVTGDVIEYHDKVETVGPYIDNLISALRARSLRAAIPATRVKRVALVSWWLDSLGGMERHIAEIACAFVRAGVAVDYLSESPLDELNVYRKQMENAGVRVSAAMPVPTPKSRIKDSLQQVGLLPVTRAVWRAAKRLVKSTPHSELPTQVASVAADNAPVDVAAATDPADNYLSVNRPFITALEELFQGENAPDILHVHGIRLGQSYLIEWAHARGIRVMYTEHVTVAEFGGAFRPESPAALMKANVIACVSSHARDSLLSILPAPRNVEISGHLVRVHKRPATVTPHPFLWICVARLERNKGIDVLLRAFAECVRLDNRFRLEIAGYGSERDNLQLLADELGIEKYVSIRGAVHPFSLGVMLDWAGGVVLASRSEAMPVSIVEAMAHGKAIVATSVGGIPELLANEVNALLVQPDDVGALANAMFRLATNDALRASIEQACAERFGALRYHEGAVVQELLELYANA